MNKKLLCTLSFSMLLPAFLRAELPPPEDTSEEGVVFLSLSRKGERPDVLPSQRSVVTRNEIQRSGARNLGEALNLVPGATFNRTGTLGAQTTLRLRGVPTSNQVQILIDDQPVGGVSIQNVDLSQIPVSDIERIEIVRGGSSVLYGANAIGGLVNVITRRHRDKTPETNIAASWGTYNTQMFQGDFGTATDKFDGFISAGRDLSDGFQQNSDFDGIHVSGRGGYSFGNGGNVSASVSRVDTEVGAPNGTPVPLGDWDGHKEQKAFDLTSRVEQKATRAQVKAVVPLGEWAVLEPSAFFGQTAYKNDPAPSPYDYQDKVKGADVRMQSPIGTTLGTSFERDEHHASGQSSVHITDWGLYVQQDLRWGPLSLDPAIRMDQHSTFGNTFNPRLGMVYRATDDLKLSATVARSFRAPTFLDLYYPDYSNPDLKPETAWSYDAGVEFSKPNGHGVRVTGYFTRIQDRIGVNASYIPINQPNAELSGVEVESMNVYKIFHSRTSYAYTRAIENSVSSSEFQTIAKTPRHTAAQEIVATLPNGWSARNALRYVHKQYEFDGDQGKKLPSFTLWDLGLTKRILSMDLSFVVENITDKHYTESVTYDHNYVPLPGRTYRIAATMRFLN